MRAIPFALLAVGLTVSAAHALTVVQITTNVSSNTTWGPTGTVVGDVFWVRNSISINSGVTLTVQPGVVVKFDGGRQLVVSGTLRAVGTAADTIVFTSIKDDNNRGGDTNGDGNATQPANSDWYGINFPDASPDNSAFYYGDFRYAGYGAGGALTFVSASDSVVNCVVRRSYYGVDCQGSAAPKLVNTSIEACTQTPIVLDFTAAPVLSSLVFSSANNGYDAFGLRGGTITSATVLPKRGATVGINPISNVTYVLLGSLAINSPGSLTIDPGVVIKPVAGYSITVNSGGALTMNGTAAVGDTITITSIHDDNFGQPNDTNNNGSITAPARGNWGQIYFAQGATGSLQRCRLKFGSNSTTQGMVEMLNNSVPVSSCLLSDAGHGLTMHGTSTPAITNVAINNMSSTPILMSVSANPTYAGVTFLANAVTALGLEGEAVAVDSRIRRRDLAGYTNITCYLMNGQLVMQSPAVLTVDPGVVIKNQLGGGGMQIDGGLVADGKPDSLIVFTSERDDLYGNPSDTNGDGSTTAPAQGNWTYIRFTSTSNDAVSRINNARLTYGSAGPYDGWATTLWITSAAPTIDSVFISKGAYGIRVDGNSTPLIDHCDINNCTYAPIVMSVLSDPIITNDSFSSNVYNALALLSETLSQSALLKYRPAVGPPAYPVFAYLPTGTITVASGVTLAIEPQVVIKPNGSYAVFSVNGALNVVGSNSTTGRVIFTSRRDDNPSYGGDTTPTDASAPQAGDWGYIQFNDISVDAACVLRNVLFQFGGSSSEVGALYTVSASPRFVRLEFFQNSTAMAFAGNSQPVVDTTNILNCTSLPISFSLVSNPVFPNPAQVALANNTYTCFGLFGESVAQDVRTRVRSLSGISNMTYCPTGTISIAFGAKWTIDPGVVIKLGRIFIDPIGTAITVDGALVADGKPDSLIVFTSSADDAFGVDVRSDGALTTPAAGQWQYIQFNAVSNDTASRINNCRIRYGGYGNTGALRFVNAGPLVDSTYVTSSYYYGVLIEGNSTPAFVACQIDSSGNVPVNLSLVSNPTFTNVQFLGNTYTALGVIAEAIAQDLRWPIRAVSGRNNMPYLLQGTLTTGLGASVTLQPGLIVKFASSGAITIQRAFQAEGRTVEPESLIVFTSYRDDFYGGDTNNDGAISAPAASDWNYVQVEGTAIDPQVRFKNCVFRYGGYTTTQGVIRCVNSSPTVDSCLIAYNYVGISAEGASNPRVHECSIYGNTYYGVNNSGASFCVDADSCWWGAASGPNDNSATADLCGLGLNAGTGDKASNNVDYTPFKTSGIVNPLIGDVSLNGQVLAYDASLVFQYLVALITLNDLQKQVADVTGAGGITGLDGVTILQYVAGIIRAFPAVNNRVVQAPPDVLAARELLRSATGSFEVRLGQARRDGGEWLVPVIARGTAPVYSVEVRLEGGAAATLAGVIAADGGRVLEAHNTVDGAALMAMGSVQPLTPGEVALLRFPAGDGDWVAPELVWARANETVVFGPVPPRPAVPGLSFLSAPAPNPARGPVALSFGLAAAEAGRSVAVRVLDLAGRGVRTLAEGPLPAGVHPLTWDLRDASGRTVGAGLYFVHVRAGGFSATRRLIVVH
ncbi:MAG: hypothetical protein HZC42_11400 [Candidatus Eisenbacteria bacterium]|nr:hypothetical protein [Candidatus Eisenbacteria bacterium]